MSKRYEKSYEIFVEQQTDKGIDIEKVKSKLANQKIETPSWGYANSGTRFKVFEQEGIPRNVFEKIDDAAQVHRVTGVTPSVALHIPWDKVDDWNSVKEHAKKNNLEIGAINPNVFQDDEYKLGSLSNEDPKIRQKALEHHLECIDIMHITDSKILSLWYADGTNYPGQGNFRRRKNYFEKCLQKVYEELRDDEKMFVEYKFFEPGFYHTDIADWGMAYCLCEKLGERAKVLVDLGHHAQGVNIEQIVAFLLDEGRLGGFHFNNRKYADDDLTAGSINPYELFLIYNELVEGEEYLGDKFDVAYLIDQSHNIKPKIAAMIQTVMNLQTAYAKALIVDRKTLTYAQKNGDVVKAENTLVEAFNTDVTPLLAQVRIEKGLNPDPLKAYYESGYLQRIIEERK